MNDQGYSFAIIAMLTGKRLRKRLSGALQHLEEAREGLANYAQEVEQLRARAEVDLKEGLAQEDEIARLRAALETYGSHGISCPKAGLFPPTEGVGYVCTCGFEKACSREPQTCDESPK